jgi:hypothetical protein
MKISSAIVTGLILSLMTLWIISYHKEHGDINAVSMYLVVFLIPTVVLVLLNGLTLELAKRAKTILIKRIISSIPFLICLTIALIGELRIPQLDGSIAFIGLISAISIGVTNITWNIKLRTN